MRSQFGVEPKGTNGRRILITGAARNKGLICDVQCEFPFAACFANTERILAREKMRLKTHVLNNRSVAHFIPFKIK